MDLKQFTEFMYSKSLEFESAIRSKAKQQLRLQDVTREINTDRLSIVQRDFKDGQRLELLLCQGNYCVLVDRNELVLRGRYGVELKRFKGKEVRKFYDQLSRTILEANEEYLKNLPF